MPRACFSTALADAGRSAKWRKTSLAAITFWRKDINRYTDGQFEEVQWNDARWRGLVQFFDNPPPPRISSRGNLECSSCKPHH